MLNFRALLRLGCGLIFGLSSLFWGALSARANVCSITSATVVNQAYVTANGCTAIEINGNVSTTWIGTVDLSGGTVTVKSGYTMTMGSSSRMVLGTNDDFVIESNATTTHLLGDPFGIQITARNVTITGKMNADGKGCAGGRSATADGFSPSSTASGVCLSNIMGAGKNGGGGGGGGSGGSHGGFGSAGRVGGGVTSTAIYGSSLSPTLLGSGGGQGYYSNAFGGHGGGRVSVTSTGLLTVNGSISVNGTNGSAGELGYNGGGAGSGGSIMLVVGTLTGTGSITANGGIGGTGNGTNSNGGGHGGGGRIAVRYDSASISLTNIVATGGSKSGWTSGENGSTFLLNRTVDDGLGTITITSGFDFPFLGDYTREAFSISSGVLLRCPYLATSTSLTVSSSAWLTLSGVDWQCNAGISVFTLASSLGLSTTNTSITFGSVTSVRIVTPAWTNVTTTISNAYATGELAVDVSSDIEFRAFTYTGPAVASTVYVTSTYFLLNVSGSASFVSSTIASNVSSTIAGALSLDSRSVISASGRGCIRGRDGANGFGPDVSKSYACSMSAAGYGLGAGGGGSAGGGAAHAGAGGRAETHANGQTTTYGSESNPSLFGSGGGSGYDYFGDTRGEGGNGGGIIRLRVSGELSVAGSITADGGAGNAMTGSTYGGGGGGSGGSLYLYLGSITGNGTISAKGGAGGAGGSASFDAGGGGGGRIAIYYSSQSGTAFSEASVAGGTVGAGATAGSPGTLYAFQTNIAPNAPGNLGSIALTNGSTTSTVTPAFTFSLADSDVSDMVKFQIQIDDSSNFGSLVIDYTSALAAQGSTSFQVGQSAGSGAYAAGTGGQSLSDGSYYWRVKTIDQNGAESSYTTANSGSVAFIVDSATRTVSFQLSSGSGLETVTATSIRIVLDTAHFEDVTVNYAVSSTLTTATGGGEDYTLTAGTATITAGQTSTTVSLTIVNDDIDELDEIVGIELSSPAYASLGATNSIQYMVLDNDTAGVSLSKTTASATEGAVTDSFTVQLTSQPTSTVQLAFSTSTYGATFSTGTIRFTSSNWNSPVTVTVSATDDSVDEETATSDVVTGSVTIPSGFAYGYDGLSVSDITVTLTDNDTAGVSLSKTSVAVTEGGVTDSYTVVLDSQPTSTVRIAFTTSTYGVTLSETAISFTSSNWSTPQTITVTATNDSVDEPSPSTSDIAATVSTPVDYVYGYSGVSVTNVSAAITDNDAAGITASTDAVALTEGGSAQSMTFVLDSAPTSTVTVTFSTSTAGITISPTALEFTSSNWSTPQSVSISATDDSIYEASHTTTVQMTVSGSVFGYPLVTPPTVTVTITDNESSDISLSASTLAITEGRSDVVTFVLASQPTSTVTLTFTPSAELTLSAPSMTFSGANWSTPQTLRITVDDNQVYSGSRSRSVSTAVSSDTAFANVVVPAVSISVTEDEPPPSGGGVGAFALPIPLVIPLPPLPPLSVEKPVSTVISPIEDMNIGNALLPAVEVRVSIEKNIAADLRAFGVRANEAQQERLGAFVQEGASPVTRSLGEGERRALVRDALETMRRADIPVEDLERIARGEIPKTRNLVEERKQVTRALPTFKAIYGQAPDFSNPEHNLAWNALLYRIRFPRDLNAERQGIQEFRAKYGRNPSDPFQWATVRVMGYVDR